MITSPFKLTYRYSPLAKELPEGLKRELRFIFMDHVTFDPAERSIYARDEGALPADLVDMVLKRKPYAVVVPRERGDLVEALRLAERHGLPVTPRGNGTSTNGAAIPAEGGLVLDMRAFRDVGPLDKEDSVLTCDPGATFDDVRRFLEPHGLAPLVEPELPWASTVGGSVALGRYGVGSAQHGSIAQQCVEATLLAPDRTVHVVRGDELALVRGLQGCTGFLLSVKLKVGPAEPVQPLLASFDSREAAAQCFTTLRGAEPWHLALLTPDFVALRQEASSVKGLQEKFHVLAAFRGGEGKTRFEAAVQEAGGKALDDKAAQREWGQRSRAIALHRMGPTVVRAECLVPAAALADALHALPAAARGRTAVDAFAAGSNQVMVRVHLLEDERRLEFPTSVGNLFAVVDASHKLGGHAAYPSLLLAGEAKRVLGEGVLARLRRFKESRDKWEVMNPGKVWPARLRGMPMAPLTTFLRTQKPLLKAVRGLVPYKGADQERAGDVAVAATMGRARGGAIADHGDALYTCSHCGLCNTTQPDVGLWESTRPRGLVLAARALLEGEGRWTEHLREAVFRAPLHRAGEAVCPSRIPLLAAHVALRTEVARTLGPLAAHEALAVHMANEGNPRGMPKAQRGAWLPQGFQPSAQAKVLYYAGCTAAHERPVVALAGLELLRKLGPVNTLGAQEPCCGHTLLSTGQREAAARQGEAAMKAILKTGCEVLVTPDPQCAWTMREFWPQVAAEKGLAWNVQVRLASEHLLPLAGKALPLAHEVAERVHFTEPCGAPDAHSLRLLQKLPGLQLATLPILPCGAPGAGREAFPEVAERCALAALDAARAAGASALVTSAPLCEAHLGEASRRGQKGVQVLDVLQLVARAAGLELPGEPAPGGPGAPAAPAAAAKPKLTPEELEARKNAALEKAAAAKAAQQGGPAP